MFRILRKYYLNLRKLKLGSYSEVGGFRLDIGLHTPVKSASAPDLPATPTFPCQPSVLNPGSDGARITSLRHIGRLKGKASANCNVLAGLLPSHQRLNLGAK
jgi:hypothetical protein